MQIHASCVARSGRAVLLIGPPGSGKSDLALRLLDHGFELVADDRVELDEGEAWAPVALAGLLEVRGLGILRVAHRERAQVALIVEMGQGERLPEGRTHLGFPVVRIDPAMPSAAARVRAALGCVTGEMSLLVGALS